MLYIDTVNVNGTEYGVTTRGSAYPVACQIGTCDSNSVRVPESIAESLDEDVVFASLSVANTGLAWMRTGQPGSYEYSLVLLADAPAPDTYVYYEPIVEQ